MIEVPLRRYFRASDGRWCAAVHETERAAWVDDGAEFAARYAAALGVEAVEVVEVADGSDPRGGDLLIESVEADTAPAAPVDLEAVAERLDAVVAAAGSPLTAEQQTALAEAARLLRGQPLDG